MKHPSPLVSIRECFACPTQHGRLVSLKTTPCPPLDGLPLLQTLAGKLQYSVAFKLLRQPFSRAAGAMENIFQDWMWRIKNHDRYFKESLVRLHQDESGQGLVEYVLLIALVAFAATAGMSSLASSINSAFSQVGTILGKYIS